ncbi:lysylphosphatidylglycerol synthase transmembrane domain-containing protein [Chloroflexota bacterium]
MHLKTKWILRSIGLILFIIILSRLDLSKLVTLLLNINPYYLILALLLFSPLLITKAVRWRLLMRGQGIEYSLKDSTTMYAASMYIGAITPGRLGDFIKVFYLKEDGYPLGKSFATVLLDRLFDILSLLVLGYAGMLLFMTLFERAIIVLSLILVATFSLIVFFICKKGLSKRILGYISANFVPERYKGNAKNWFFDFSNAIKAIKTSQLILATFVTFLGWALYFLIMYLLALSVDIDISFLYLATCVSIAAVITLLPISIAGIGTRDAALIILFSYLGLSRELAIAFSIMILFMYAVNGFIGLGAWLKKPVSITGVSGIKKTRDGKNEK